jgi:hypothetical protein
MPSGLHSKPRMCNSTVLFFTTALAIFCASISFPLVSADDTVNISYSSCSAIGVLAAIICSFLPYMSLIPLAIACKNNVILLNFVLLAGSVAAVPKKWRHCHLQVLSRVRMFQRPHFEGSYTQPTFPSTRSTINITELEHCGVLTTPSKLIPAPSGPAGISRIPPFPQSLFWCDPGGQAHPLPMETRFRKK